MLLSYEIRRVLFYDWVYEYRMLIFKSVDMFLKVVDEVKTKGKTLCISYFYLGVLKVCIGLQVC